MLRLMVVFAFSLTASLTQASEIHWEVEHPFRYFKQPSDLWLQQEALKQLEEEDSDAARFAPISHIERKLNNPSWWKDNNPLLEQLKQMRVKEKRSPELDLRLGWGSFLTNSAPDKRGEINQTCWNAKTQRHDNCVSSEMHGTTGDPVAVVRSPYRIDQGRYIYPKFHRIVLRLKDNSIGGRTCVWNAAVEIFLAADIGLNRELKSITAPCEDVIPARVKYTADRNAPGVEVTVEVHEGAAGSEVIETPRALVKVRDILIFALGDSYSSGEGNPEIPAKLSSLRAIGPARPKGTRFIPTDSPKFFGVPRRSPAGDDSAAIWTDRRCHRSVYSYQTRVALQIAIAPDKEGNRHHAVTYLQFTCSGAEVTEDILYSSEGRECIDEAIKAGTHNDTSHRFYMPQISKASRELCQFAAPTAGLRPVRFSDKTDRRLRVPEGDHYLADRRYFAERLKTPECKFKRDRNIRSDPTLRFCEPGARARQIDLVLMSVGGNDIGFSKVVAKAIVDDEHRLLRLLRGVPIFGASIESGLFLGEDEANERIARLPHRLRMYDAALRNFLGMEGSRVLTMAYPSLIYQRDTNDRGRFCPDGNTITDVSEFLKLNGDFLPAVERIVERQCQPNGTRCGLIDAIKRSSSNFGWRFVDSHRKLFRSHGICAIGSRLTPNESGQRTAEIQGIPYKWVDLTKTGVERQYSAPWKPYDPVTQYFPYESRKSGFRTPVQDFMNIHYFKEKMPDDWVENPRASAIALAQRILGGSFHPTAQAHSHIADHVYCQAREQLFGEACDVQKVLDNAHPW